MLLCAFPYFAFGSEGACLAIGGEDAGIIVVQDSCPDESSSFGLNDSAGEADYYSGELCDSKITDTEGFALVDSPSAVSSGAGEPDGQDLLEEDAELVASMPGYFDSVEYLSLDILSDDVEEPMLLSDSNVGSEVVIVIDPGHGGSDGGASGYVTEKGVNLAIVQYCVDLLSDDLAGVGR